MFEHRWNEIAEPFDWRFTRDDLAALIERLRPYEPQLMRCEARDQGGDVGREGVLTSRG